MSTCQNSIGEVRQKAIIRMRKILALDTEFNGFGGELISLALYCPTHQWYAAVEYDGPTQEWVAQNVIPKLGTTPLRKPVFKAEFQRFIAQLNNPIIVCDWYEDAIHFLSLYRGTEYATSLNRPCTVELIDTPPNIVQPQNPHNAMSDAIALFEYLKTITS